MTCPLVDFRDAFLLHFFVAAYAHGGERGGSLSLSR